MKSIQLGDFIAKTATTPSERTLADSIGDSFLYEKNPIFRNVRDRILNLGFRFSQDPSMSYFGWPFLGLDEILESKRLPYKANLRAMKNLEQARPGRFTLGDTFKSYPERNFIFHESCHAIAEDIWKNTPLDRSTSDDRVLNALFSESCAYGSELTSYAFANSPEEEYSLVMNSYFKPIGKSYDAIKAVTRSVGAEKTLTLGILFYLHVNYFVKLSDDIIEQSRRLVLDTPAGDAGLQESLRSMADFTSTLNEAFRKRTTELFLNYRGIDGSIEEMTRTTPEEMTIKARSVLPAAISFASLICP